MSLTIFWSLQILITSPDPNHLWSTSNTSFYVLSWILFLKLKNAKAQPWAKRKIKALPLTNNWNFVASNCKCKYHNLCSFFDIISGHNVIKLYYFHKNSTSKFNCFRTSQWMGWHLNLSSCGQCALVFGITMDLRTIFLW